MQFNVQICVFLWSLSFTQREEEKEKKKQEQNKNKKQSALWHMYPGQKVRANFEWASQNTWSATTEIENLKMCHAHLISLQESMKKYCGIP